MIESVCNNDGDGLTVEAHIVILQDVEAFTDGGVDAGLVRQIRQLLRIAVRYQRHDAGHALDLGALDPGHAAETDGSAGDHGVELIRLVEIGGVMCRASDFGATIHTGQRLSNEGHAHATSPAISSARTIVRGKSSTLK